MAAEAIQKLGDSRVVVSRFFMTPCFPRGAGPDYVNAALAVETSSSPSKLLSELHAIEANFGRERVERWGQRTLDLDLLAIGNRIIPDDATVQIWLDMAPEKQRLRAPNQLILPHPRLHERSFVLIPLLDIAPDWVHPVLGQTVLQLADALSDDDKMAVKPL